MKYWLLTIKYIENGYDYDMEYLETLTTRGPLVKFLNDACDGKAILLNHLEITEEEWRKHKTSTISKRIEN